MFGRKAILHTARAGKRKWQLEQEKGGSESSEDEFTGEKKSRGGPRKLQLEDDADDDRGGSDADLSDEEEGLRKEAKPKAPKAPPDERQQAAAGAPEGTPAEGPPDAQQPAQQEPKGEEEDEEDSEEGDEDAGGQKRKRFAWMDSEDEVSEGEDEEAGAAGSTPGRKGAAGPGSTGAAAAPAAAASVAGAQAAEAAQFPPLPPANLAGLSGPMPPMPAVRVSAGGLQTPLLQSIRPGMLRPSLRPPPVLPPGTRLPKLTQEHLALMAQISLTRSIDELWDLVNTHSDEFAAAHAATSLFRLSMLNSAANGASLDQKLEKHSAFVKLSNRVDELFATAEGRASFLPADLAMVASALAKLVQAPAKEGALGRIFADVADEVEMRVSVEPAAFTPPMLGDVAWGVSRSGETTNGVCKAVISPAMRRFFGAVIEAAQSRLPEMTCQDLANFAGAYADATREDADELLRGIFDQTTQRLAYHPPPTNALFSASVVPGQPPSTPQPGVAPLRPALPPPPPAVMPAPSGHAPPPTVGGLRPAMPPGIVSAPAPAPVGSGAEASEAADNGLAANADDKSRRVAPAAPAKEKPPHWQQSGQWKFTGTQISEIASAVSKHINLYEPDLFDLVARQFLQRLQEFTTNELRKLRDAFDIVRHDRDFEFLRNMKMILKQREVRRPCKAYRLGNCKFGDRCVYSHED